MDTDLLDVVIGVVFVWFLLSMVLSAVHEGFALVTHARAKHLWLGIGRLLNPATTPLPRRLLDVAWRVPFAGTMDLRPKAVSGAAGAPGVVRPVRGGRPSFLRITPSDWTQRPAEKVPEDLRRVRAGNQRLYAALEARLTEVAKPGRLSKVTQVAGAAFADAALQLARNVHTADLVESAADLEWPRRKVRWLRQRLGAFPADRALDASEVMARAEPGGASPEELRVLYQHATRRLSARDVAGLFTDNPDLVKAVRQAAAAVGVDERVVAVRGVVESWFERQMAQLSVFYRRQTRKVLFLLAVPLVLFTHANAILLFQELRDDANLRVAAAGAATAAAAGDIGDVCPDEADGEGEPTTTTTTAGTGATTDPLTAATDRLRCAQGAIERLTQFRAGLAWEELKQTRGAKPTPEDPDAEARPEWADVLPYLGNALADDWGFLGRAITLVAVLFGAQFWFDVLRRLIGIRRVLTTSASGGTTAG